MEQSSSEPTWQRIARKGFKLGRMIWLSVRAGGALALMALANLTDQYGLQDVQDFLRAVFGHSTRLMLIIIVGSMAYLMLKSYFKAPKGFSARPNLDDGDSH